MNKITDLFVFKIRMLNGHTLTPTWTDSLAQVGDHYGHKMNHYHRADLHRTLRELAQDTTYSPETPVTIKLGTEVVEIDCEKATLALEDGMMVLEFRKIFLS